MTKYSPARVDRDRRPDAGFTLLELVVVMGVIAVLIGAGIGFLQRGSSARGETLSILGGELRRAALSARAGGLPAEVALEPGAPGELGSVRARILEPLAVWHLEPDERPLPSYAPTLSGSFAPL